MNKRKGNLLSILAFIFLLLQAFVIILTYNELPLKIPSHLNWSGNLSNMASKDRIWKLLVTSIIIYVILTAIIKSRILDRNYNYNNLKPEEETALLEAGKVTIILLRVISTLTFLTVTMLFIYYSFK